MAVSLIFLSLLLGLVSSIAAQQWMITGTATTTPCLDTAESYLIALRWLQIFQTDTKGAGTGAAIVSSTLAPNFTYFDEGASFGKVGAVYSNASQVETSVSGLVPAEGDAITCELLTMDQVWL